MTSITDTPDRQPIEVIAAHEAGHAVISALFGARLIAVSVQPTIKDNGGCLSDWTNCVGAGDDGSRQIHQLIALAAGVAAAVEYQRRHGLPIDESGAADDRRRIFKGARKVLGYYTTAEMIEAAMDFARCEADRLVEIHWHRIARLSRVLLVLGRLDKGIPYDTAALGDIAARFVACVSDAGWRADTLHTPADYEPGEIPETPKLKAAAIAD